MQQRDWSLLPPELIQFISEKILCITDYVYFRVVCWGWRRASLPQPSHLPPQLPWLLLPTISGDETIREPEILFYDLYRSKMSTLRHPVFQGSQIKDASLGWLILEKDKDVVLLNPVTGAHIPAAPLSGVPNIFPIPENSELSPTNLIIKKSRTGRGYMQKAILTCAPSPDSSGCMVVGLFQSNWILAFCRIGDEHWTLIEDFDFDYYDYDHYGHGYEDHGGPDIKDIAWYNNLLYAIDSNGGVYIYDLYSPSKRYVVAPVAAIPVGIIFLVEGASEPMAVVQPFGIIYREYEVFEWTNEEPPAWRQVHDIGDVVLFLNSYPRHGISIPCAYFRSSRWRGSQICSRQRSICLTGVSIKLKELGNGDMVEIANLEDLFPKDSSMPLWLTPSYF